MALETYNAAKHHIGLGPVGGADYGFTIDGNYQKSAQRMGAVAQYGGTRNLESPSILTRWTQDAFDGGVYKEFWGDDPAMFWRSQNMLPSLLEKSVRTVPPMVWWGRPGKVDASDALAIFASGAKISVVRAAATTHYAISDATLTTSNHATDEVLAACHDPNDNYIYAICEDGSARKLKRYKSGTGIALIDTFPGPAPNNVHGMEMSGKDIVCSLGGVFYLVDIADNRSSAEFTRVGRLGGGWKDSVPYNGIVYILITDGEQTTRLIQWDGQSLLAVTEWPYNFIGDCIVSYGGRLFVGGSGRDVTGTQQYAELYEVNGSSLRLVRSFADEARAGRTVPNRITDMVVHEGFLFCGVPNVHYLIAYDITRDALFQGPQIVPDPSSRTAEVKFLLSTNQKLFAWCDDPAGSGGTSADGFYRLAVTSADLQDPSAFGGGGTDVTNYNGIVETSDFAPEPDRDKRWSQLRVLTRLAVNGAAAVTARYSTDGGISYSALSASAVTTGSFTTTTFDLGAVALSKQIRFEFTFAKGTSMAYTELLAFTCTFLMTDEDRANWAFTIANVNLPEQLDRPESGQPVLDLEAADEQLWAWWAAKTPLDFTDTNGDVHRVVITDIAESKPIIAGREGFLNVVLTEF